MLRSTASILLLCRIGSERYASVPSAPNLNSALLNSGYFLKRAESSFAKTATSYLPAWVRNRLPGQKESGTSQSANSERNEEDEKQLKKLKDMDTLGYSEFLRVYQADQAAPLPRFPPVSHSNYEYVRYLDSRYMQHVRLLQHEKICNFITPDESTRIVEERFQVLKDEAFLETIADRTGVYMYMEVKDCIRAFLDTRDHFNMVWSLKRMGREVGGEDQNKLLREMKQQRRRDEYERKLRKRDPDRCPLLPVLGWAGTDSKCTLTGLDFWKCCGATMDVKKREDLIPQDNPNPQRSSPRDKRFLRYTPRPLRKHKNMIDSFDQVQFQTDKKL